MLCHIQNIFVICGSATLYFEGIDDVLCLRLNSFGIGNIVCNSPHIFPVKLLGIQAHSVVKVGLIDIEIHHSGIRAADLGNIGLTETSADLSCLTPIFNLSCHLGVAAFYHASDYSMSLACTLQVCHSLTYGTTGIQVTQPDGNIGIGIVRRQLLLHIDTYYRHIQITDRGKYVIGSCIGQQLQEYQIYVCSTKFITCCHSLFLGGHHATINDIYSIGNRLLEILILCLEIRHQLGELGQICSQSDGKYTDLCLCVY